ncbi:hypothetical protein GT037_009591 [Alternaria burnsii]|uniref:Uncharacterized protein n=1 Tax=Alternaria burnsii TaxID=1187904 RepID=A0A8H7AXM2_9PLEO|nr:uncharacterized protein GT037_009591 [Alternaria burnsii]KAF7672560.1 hypothetical protein GT037_009591 [Alternaria burnsii]
MKSVSSKFYLKTIYYQRCFNKITRLQNEVVIPLCGLHRSITTMFPQNLSRSWQTFKRWATESKCHIDKRLIAARVVQKLREDRRTVTYLFYAERTTASIDVRQLIGTLCWNLLNQFPEDVELLTEICNKDGEPTDTETQTFSSTCGEFLYSDSEEKTPGSLDQLAARLKQQSSQSSQHGTPASIPPPKKAHTRQASTVGYNMPGGSSSSSNGQNNLANIVARSTGLKAVRSLPSTALQLCIGTGKYKIEMKPLTRPNPVGTDGEISAMIRARYETASRSILPIWARFKKPDKAIFVKFFFGPKQTVSLDYETPSKPPATEVRHNYEYDPCPIELPPMNSRVFFHHFYAPKSHHPDVFWSERLPWKVGPALGPKEIGWGIHFEENPDWPLFAALMCLLLLLSGAVAGIYGWKMKDAQTGVAIGAWLTSVQVMGITAVFFWWN